MEIGIYLYEISVGPDASNLEGIKRKKFWWQITLSSHPFAVGNNNFVKFYRWSWREWIKNFLLGRYLRSSKWMRFDYRHQTFFSPFRISDFHFWFSLLPGFYRLKLTATSKNFAPLKILRPKHVRSVRICKSGTEYGFLEGMILCGTWCVKFLIRAPSKLQQVFSKAAKKWTARSAPKTHLQIKVDRLENRFASL